MHDLGITEKRLREKHDSARVEYNQKQTRRSGDSHAARDGRRRHGSMQEDAQQSAEDIGRRINGKPLSQEGTHDSMTATSSAPRGGTRGGASQDDDPRRDTQGQPRSSGTSQEQPRRVTSQSGRQPGVRDRRPGDRPARTVHMPGTYLQRFPEHRSSTSSRTAAPSQRSRHQTSVSQGRPLPPVRGLRGGGERRPATCPANASRDDAISLFPECQTDMTEINNTPEDEHNRRRLVPQGPRRDPHEFLNAASMGTFGWTRPAPRRV